MEKILVRSYRFVEFQDMRGANLPWIVIHTRNRIYCTDTAAKTFIYSASLISESYESAQISFVFQSFSISLQPDGIYRKRKKRKRCDFWSSTLADSVQYDFLFLAGTWRIRPYFWSIFQPIHSGNWRVKMVFHRKGIKGRCINVTFTCPIL